MSSKYIQTLLDLLPCGSAWNKSSTSNLYKFLDGFCDELQLADDRIVQLSIEANPGAASETLDDWERILGLPDVDDDFYPSDDAGRRQAIVSKLNGYTAPTIPSIKVLAESYGIDSEDVSITEFFSAPFSAGDRSGDPVNSEEWHSVYDIHTPYVSNYEQFKRAIRKAKHAHTYPRFRYDFYERTTLSLCSYAYFFETTFYFTTENGLLYTSLNGSVLTSRSIPGHVDFLGALKSNGSLFVVVGGSLPAPSPIRVLTSSDGLTWTPGTHDGGAGAGTFYAVEYGAGVWVIGGQNGELQTSTDGVAWTTRTGAVVAYYVDIKSIAFGNGVFVAVGGAGEGPLDGSFVEYSSDGISWTLSAFDNSAYGIFKSVIFAQENFWAVGPRKTIQKSSDGITWVKMFSDDVSNVYFNSICYSYDLEVFTVVGDDGNVYHSHDGEQWNQNHTHNEQYGEGENIVACCAGQSTVTIVNSKIEQLLGET